MAYTQLESIQAAFDAAFLRMCQAMNQGQLEQELSNVLHHLYRLGELGKNRLGKPNFHIAIRSFAEARGALWARTMDTHDLVVSAVLEDVMSDFYTEMYGVLVWKPLSSLSQSYDEHGRHVDYESRLEGRPVLDTVRKAFDDLASLV